ncbi:MAG: hypothetical protein H0U75_10770 [Legionella sp.]|nr:hypothetical protein [Legionella sp.]
MANQKVYLELALKEAMIGVRRGDGAPFGACIVSNNQLIAIAHDTF